MNVLKSMLLPLTALLLLATSAGWSAGSPTQATIKLPPELARILTDYETAWQAEDEKALAALFTEDGFVLSSGRPPIRGRQNIQQHYQNSGGPLALRALAYATDGALGYIIGGFTRQLGEPDVGKFTLTVRKGADGVWLIVSDMDNSNQRNER